MPRPIHTRANYLDLFETAHEAIVFENEVLGTIDHSMDGIPEVAFAMADGAGSEEQTSEYWAWLIGQHDEMQMNSKLDAPKTRISKDPNAEDEYCWFASSGETLDHEALDIAHHPNITDTELVAQARAQGFGGQIVVLR